MNERPIEELAYGELYDQLSAAYARAESLKSDLLHTEQRAMELARRIDEKLRADRKKGR